MCLSALFLLSLSCPRRCVHLRAMRKQSSLNIVLQMLQKPFFFGFSSFHSTLSFFFFLSTLHTPHSTLSPSLTHSRPRSCFSTITDHTLDQGNNSDHSIETSTPLFFLHATTLLPRFQSLLNWIDTEQRRPFLHLCLGQPLASCLFLVCR